LGEFAVFKKSALVNMILSYAPIGIGVLLAILVPGAMRNPNAYLVVAIAFYTLGFVLFAAAKVQNIRKGYLVSFGSAQMSNWQRWAYRLGYFLMAIGFLLTIVLAITPKTTRL
jgi:hypothetical protein